MASSRRPSSSYASQLPLDEEEEYQSLREDIQAHLEKLKLPSWAGSLESSVLPKSSIRAMHEAQRAAVLLMEKRALGPKIAELLGEFANGNEIVPTRITPYLVPVESDSADSALFRLATLIWSVPVSKGYGRRMRYLVRDGQNGRLVGVFALTDPVFNLRARDELIGWNAEQRRANLVHAMDAYVVGAVPPYSSLLGGKLVATMIGTREVSEAFAHKYGQTTGIISQKRKAARLALVTVTSALGRSSIYNRLKLKSVAVQGQPERILVDLIRVGETEGFGHFHLSEALFQRLRRVVIHAGHAYGNGHGFGEGPNWRIRLSRVGLSLIGLDPDLLRHGIGREIYVMPLATNWREFLRGEVDEAWFDRPSVDEMGSEAVRRWVIPRSERDQTYTVFQRNEILQLIE